MPSYCAFLKSGVIGRRVALVTCAPVVVVRSSNIYYSYYYIVGDLGPFSEIHKG